MANESTTWMRNFERKPPEERPSTRWEMTRILSAVLCDALSGVYNLCFLYLALVVIVSEIHR